MREKYFQDKNGFSLWKKVVAGMSAGGEHRSVGEFFQSRPPSLEKIFIKYMYYFRFWSVHGFTNRSDKNPNPNGGKTEVTWLRSPGRGSS